jgi:alpha-D-ribose 1-methylphosphonate 5-triphosphate synthase subunit PhnI
MAYVAVKGGEQAIQNAEMLLKAQRRGNPEVPELTLEQIKQQMKLAVDRVMCESSLYDPDLAALAIKQSWGDLVEAIFLLRAYRTTLPRLYYSQPIDTSQMRLQRRISSIFKDVPGGQRLGATFDYIHRLLDFKLAAEGTTLAAPEAELNQTANQAVPRIIDTLGQEGLIQAEEAIANSQPSETNDSSNSLTSELVNQSSNESVNGLTNSFINLSTHDSTCEPKPCELEPFDLTRQPLSLPAGRDARLQNLSRADEGFLLGLAYSTQRGYGKNHPFAGEIRVGQVEVVICPEELGFEVAIADITMTEVQMVNQFKGSQTIPPQFTRGYGLTFGYNERKAMAMALVDRALRAKEFGEEIAGPAQQEEFVLYHSDNVEAQGFVQHLKLPHYIDFQAELNLLRKLRQNREEEARSQVEDAKFSSEAFETYQSSISKSAE